MTFRSYSHICSLAFATLLSLPISSPISAQTTGSFSNTERHVIELIDQRVPADSLTPYLADKNPDVAWRAAVGLANLGDVSSRTAIIRQLRAEKRESVREALGYALGVLGQDSLASEMLEDIVNHQAKPNGGVYWKALGRAVPKTDLGKLAVYLKGSNKEWIAQDAANAFLALGVRKISTPDLIHVANDFADNASADVRWRAAYFLGRAEDSAGLAKYIDHLRELTLDLGSPEVRMFVAMALGKIHSPEAENILIKAFKGEKEWRVRTNIVLALSRRPALDSAMLWALRQAIEWSSKTERTSQHVALAAVTTLEQMIDAGKLSSADSAQLRTWLRTFAPQEEKYSDISNLVRSATAPVLARIDSKDVFEELVDLNATREPPAMINAIRGTGWLRDTMVFKALLESMATAQPQDMVFRLEAMDRLWQYAKKNPQFMRDLESMRLANIYRYMLIRLPNLVQDPAVVTTTLSSMQDSAIVIDTLFRHEAERNVTNYLTTFIGKSYRDQMIATLQAAKWLNLKSPVAEKGMNAIYAFGAENGDKWLMDSARTTLSALGLKLNTELKPKISPPSIDWNLIESTPDTMVIRTDKGAITIKLLKRDAPLSVLNFVKLAKDQYYASLVFHRIVPNFVIQTGDQTGTGSGGPAYMIRTEIAPDEYDVAGRVGMASSGKDTEGSQWFITHLPTPHLDTRYTIFAQVLSGMDVVDNIQLYDKVENILPVKH